MSEKKITSTDIKIALAQAHAKDYFITECKNGSTYFPPAQGLLKFDGLAIRISYTQPCITGYEIKVSRGDYKQDGKWHLYEQYCNEFYFVCPAGLIKKEELPIEVGLKYYYPETGAIRTKKKAIYRRIEKPVSVYEYIIYSRLTSERTPFYESRAEYAKAYIKDQFGKKNIGRELGSKMAQELSELQSYKDNMDRANKELKKLRAIEKVLEKNQISYYSDAEEIATELDGALQGKVKSHDFEWLKRDLKEALERIERIEGRNEKEKSV